MAWFCPALEVICAEALVERSVGDHMVGGREDRGGDRGNRFFGAAPCGSAPLMGPGSPPQRGPGTTPEQAQQRPSRCGRCAGPHPGSRSGFPQARICSRRFRWHRRGRRHRFASSEHNFRYRYARHPFDRVAHERSNLWHGSYSAGPFLVRGGCHISRNSHNLRLNVGGGKLQ